MITGRASWPRDVGGPVFGLIVDSDGGVLVGDGAGFLWYWVAPERSRDPRMTCACQSDDADRYTIISPLRMPMVTASVRVPAFSFARI